MSIQLNQVSHLLSASRLSNADVVQLDAEGMNLAKSSWLGRVVSFVSSDANKATAAALLKSVDSSGLHDSTGMNEVRKLLSDSLDKGRPLTARVVRQVLDTTYTHGIQLQKQFGELKADLTPEQRVCLDGMKDKPLEYRMALLEKLPVVSGNMGQIASLPIAAGDTLAEIQQALLQPARNILNAVAELPPLPEPATVETMMADILLMAVKGDPDVGEVAFRRMDSPVAREAILFANAAELVTKSGTPESQCTLPLIRNGLGNALGVVSDLVSGLRGNDTADAIFGREIEKGLQLMLAGGGPETDSPQENTSYIPPIFMEEVVPKGHILLGSLHEKQTAEAETPNLAALSSARREVLGTNLVTQENTLALLEQYFSAMPELGVAVTQVLSAPLGGLHAALSESLTWSPIQASIEVREGMVTLEISTVVSAEAGVDGTATLPAGTFGLSYTCVIQETPDTGLPLSVKILYPRIGDHTA